MKDNYWTSGKFIWFSYCQQLNNSHKGFNHSSFVYIAVCNHKCEPCRHWYIWAICVCARVCMYKFNILKGYWHYHAAFFSEPEKPCYLLCRFYKSSYFLVIVSHVVKRWSGMFRSQISGEVLGALVKQWPSYRVQECIVFNKCLTDSPRWLNTRLFVDISKHDFQEY